MYGVHKANACTNPENNRAVKPINIYAVLHHTGSCTNHGLYFRI